MIVVVFRSRLRADVDLAALEAAGMRMYELATAMPGFMAYKEYAAKDGELLSIVEFRDEPSVAAWGRHPEHVAIQERGRREFMSDYLIQVCIPLHDLESPEPGRRIALVRWRAFPEADPAAISASLQHLHDVERSLPGFISYQDFSAEDGANLTVLEFAGDAAIAQWRTHPEFVKELEQARQTLVSEYHFQFCTPLRVHVFHHDQ